VRGVELFIVKWFVGFSGPATYTIQCIYFESKVRSCNNYQKKRRANRQKGSADDEIMFGWTEIE
jgi:hypothetical protein